MAPGFNAGDRIEFRTYNFAVLSLAGPYWESAGIQERAFALLPAAGGQ